MRSLFTFIATLGPIGRIPFAPGTFGTLAALLVHHYFPLASQPHFFVILFGSLLGSLAASQAEKALKKKDSGMIVIDEFIGYYTAVFLVPHTLFYTVSAFVLFRVFDISKPFGIRSLERRFPGGLAVMADDIAAGAVTNCMLQAVVILLRLAGR